MTSLGRSTLPSFELVFIFFNLHSTFIRLLVRGPSSSILTSYLTTFTPVFGIPSKFIMSDHVAFTSDMDAEMAEAKHDEILAKFTAKDHDKDEPDKDIRMAESKDEEEPQINTPPMCDIHGDDCVAN